MITLVRLIFLVPTIVLIPVICYFIRWNKERILLALFLSPTLFFIDKILNYQYFQSDQLFVEELIGFILSLFLPIAYLIYLNKKR